MQWNFRDEWSVKHVKATIGRWEWSLWIICIPTIFKYNRYISVFFE